MTYDEFLRGKSQLPGGSGFKPLWIPDFLFDFQKAITERALANGRYSIFADCGLGKTPMGLTWAENVIRKTNGRVLIAAPLSVGSQTVEEGEKFGIEVHHSRDGKFPTAARSVITNYEQLDKFNPDDFDGMACDESSILKHFSGHTQKTVTHFMRKLPYRSLWTATAAPNDYSELGTSSEAIGALGYVDMLGRFFKNDERCQGRARTKHDGLASFGGNYWRLKAHAQDAFWRWVCSWAIACRKPSDLGFDDARFKLPPLIENSHTIQPKRPGSGMLFTLPACGLTEEREERRRTIRERCEFAAMLVAHSKPAVIWCHLNAEGDLLEQLIPGAVQVCGADSDEAKEEAYAGFKKGSPRVLITKPKIGAWGLNWQHCSHVVTFASHSYEQYYQSVRRCWRFGQENPVTVDVIASEGEKYVAENMARKAVAATKMFEQLIRQMNNAMRIKRAEYTLNPEMPAWIN